MKLLFMISAHFADAERDQLPLSSSLSPLQLFRHFADAGHSHLNGLDTFDLYGHTK